LNRRSMVLETIALPG